MQKEFSGNFFKNLEKVLSKLCESFERIGNFLKANYKNILGKFYKKCKGQTSQKFEKMFVYNFKRFNIKYIKVFDKIYAQFSKLLNKIKNFLRYNLITCINMSRNDGGGKGHMTPT